MKGEGLTPSERIARGQRAKDMLADPVLEEAFEVSRQQFIEEWLQTPNPDLQRAAWAKVHALEAVKDDLRRTVSDGQMAAEARKPR